MLYPNSLANSDILNYWWSESSRSQLGLLISYAIRQIRGSSRKLCSQNLITTKFFVCARTSSSFRSVEKKKTVNWVIPAGKFLFFVTGCFQSSQKRYSLRCNKKKDFPVWVTENPNPTVSLWLSAKCRGSEPSHGSNLSQLEQLRFREEQLPRRSSETLHQMLFKKKRQYFIIVTTWILYRVDYTIRVRRVRVFSSALSSG